MPTPSAPIENPVMAGPRLRPWESIPRDLETLRTRGGTPEVGLRIAEGFAALGLREPASVWAKAVGEHLGLDPSIGERFQRVGESLASMPESRVDAEALIERARASIERLPDRLGALREAFGAWADRTRALGWYRTTGGELVAFDTGVEPIDERWLRRFAGAREASEAALLEANLPRPSGVPAPVILHGMSSPWMLRRLCAHYAPLPLGAVARIIVLEEDPAKALDAIAQESLDDELAAERVRLFLGPGGADAMIAWLEANDAHWSSAQYYAEPGRSPDPALAERIRSLIEAQSRRCAALIRSNAEAYAGRSSGGAPERVLIITTRFSTYIQHAARDIASATEKAGAKARLVIEPDACSEINGLTIAQAIDEFRPDVVVQLNYTRAQFGEILPRGLAMVTWVQDAMPHLFRRETGESVGERDLVVGSIFKSFVSEHAYPESRCVRFGVPASCAKFHRRASGPVEIEHDVIAATNHGENPERMSARLEGECASAGMAPGLGARTCELVIEALERWRWGWLDWTLLDCVHRAVREFDLPPDGPVARCLHRDVANPLANRVLRFRALRWARELALERGLRFRIYGNGWERDEAFGAFAGGPLEHGEALRRAYAGAAVTLHAGANWITHQRLYECALSGGLPAAMLRPDDTAHAIRHARESLRERGVRPTLCRIANRAHGVPAIDDPEAAIALSIAQRLRLPGERPEHAGERVFDPDLILGDGLMPIGKGDLSPAPTIREIPSKLEQLRLIDALSECMFADKESLARLIERARDDHEWRRARSEAIARIAERSYSYESLAPKILGLLAGVS